MEATFKIEFLVVSLLCRATHQILLCVLFMTPINYHNAMSVLFPRSNSRRPRPYNEKCIVRAECNGKPCDMEERPILQTRNRQSHPSSSYAQIPIPQASPRGVYGGVIRTIGVVGLTRELPPLLELGTGILVSTTGRFAVLVFVFRRPVSMSSPVPTSTTGSPLAIASRVVSRPLGVPSRAPASGMRSIGREPGPSPSPPALASAF